MQSNKLDNCVTGVKLTNFEGAELYVNTCVLLGALIVTLFKGADVSESFEFIHFYEDESYFNTCKLLGDVILNNPIKVSICACVFVPLFNR